MAAKTWEDCFDYALRLSRIGRHPPFWTEIRSRWSAIQVILQWVLIPRLVVTIINLQEGMLMSIICLLLTLNGMVRLLQMYARAGEYREYMKEIDKFLEAIETTPIPEGRDTFMMIWKKEKPEKISTIVLVASLFFVYAWVVRGVYIAAVSEKVPPPPYWSPFFERSIYIQWIYVLQDLVMAFPMIYVSWFTDMTFTSLITFHHAQLLYVRRLAHLIPENGYPLENRENLIWWIKVHQQILRSVYKVNDLLGLHAFCSYCTQTCFAVLSIVVLLFQGLNLTSSQRIFCLSLSVCQLLWFGYTCRIVDKWEEEQNDIQQSLFSEKLMGSDKWLLSAYKIIMVRLNRPLKFTGLQFVTINSVTFRVMVFNIYSLYTSLMSILNAKTAVQPEE